MELDELETGLAATLHEWVLRKKKEELAVAIAAIELDLTETHDRLYTMEANAVAAGQDPSGFKLENVDFQRLLGHYSGLSRALEVTRGQKSLILDELFAIIKDRKERENS